MRRPYAGHHRNVRQPRLSQRRGHRHAEADSIAADSRLWAVLQRASGGTWSGCVYDVDRIVAALDAGVAATRAADPGETWTS